jgi:hypothetical protein
MRFLSKARKELKVGLSSALHVTGLRKDEEDPDFLARDATLREWTTCASTLLTDIRAFCAEVGKVGAASNLIHTKLKQPEAPDTQILGITASLVQDQLATGCIRPLEEFLSHTVLFEKLRAKRSRNRRLAASSSGDEGTRRTTKYRTYHAAFIQGVDALAAKALTIFQAVFHAHYYYAAQFGAAVIANLERIGVGAGFAAGFPQAACPQPPRAAFAPEIPAGGFGAPSSEFEIPAIYGAMPPPRPEEDEQPG